MKVLKNAGKFEVLSKTEDIIRQISSAARTCYRSFDKQSPENDLKLVKHLLTRNHLAMIEFADMTVKFTNISRGVTHELVRHRLCSYGQESTRYVDESELEVVVPPHKDEHRLLDRESQTDGYKCNVSLVEMLEDAETHYRTLRKEGFRPEDARVILPIATRAPICIKANMREWIHIFTTRCDIYAHWEIRAIMLDLLEWCQSNVPLIFDNFHFFKTEFGQKYARPLLSNTVLRDKIKHQFLANPEEKGELLKYIESL